MARYPRAASRKDRQIQTKAANPRNWRGSLPLMFEFADCCSFSCTNALWAWQDARRIL